MIWGIILFTWGLTTALVWQSHKRWIVLPGITLFLSLGLYYYLGHPNLPDHPYRAMIGLLKSKPL